MQLFYSISYMEKPKIFIQKECLNKFCAATNFKLLQKYCIILKCGTQLISGSARAI